MQPLRIPRITSLCRTPYGVLDVLLLVRSHSAPDSSEWRYQLTSPHGTDDLDSRHSGKPLRMEHPERMSLARASNLHCRLINQNPSRHYFASLERHHMKSCGPLSPNIPSELSCCYPGLAGAARRASPVLSTSDGGILLVLGLSCCLPSQEVCRRRRDHRHKMAECPLLKF